MIKKEFFWKVVIFFLLFHQSVFAQLRIMPLGNSITQGNHGWPSGYRDDLAQFLLDEGIIFDMVGSLSDGTDFYPHHEGHSGWTADEIDVMITDWLEQSFPDIVLLHIGTNDVSHYEPNVETIIEIESILDKIYSYNNDMIILFCSLIPRRDYYTTRPQMTQELNSLIIQLYNQKRNEGLNIYYVGQNEAFLANPNWESDYMDDNVHPMDEGYHIMAITFFDILRELLSPTYYSISGYALYYTNSNAINDVTVNLYGSMSQSHVTDVDGFYEFYNLPHDEDFMVQPQKDSVKRTENNSILVYSAALTLRHVVGLDSLSPFQQIAADVNKDGQILAYDAALIARYVLRLPSYPDDHVGEWHFIPEQNIYQNLDADQYNENFIGILLGDVSGYWSPMNISKPKLSKFEWLSNINVEPDDDISIPLNIFEESLLSFEGSVEFPDDKLQFIKITKSKKVENFNFYYNIEGNIIDFVAYTAHPIQIEGESICLNFKIKSNPGNSDILSLKKFQINDHSIGQAITRINISEKENSLIVYKNYPNPFNPSTIISYEISQPGDVKIIIYNSIGQEIMTLLDETKHSGFHNVMWNGIDTAGRKAANGIYFYRVIYNNQIINNRMIKLQ